MSSRTIHMRVKDRTIVGCLRFLESQGVQLEGQPLSSLISLALDSFAATLNRQKMVTIPDAHVCTAYLNDRYGRAKSEIALDLHPEALSEGVEEAKVGIPAIDSRERLKEVIRQQAERVSEADISLDSEDLPVDEPQQEVTPQTPPWPDDLRPFSFFQKLAPKDIYIQFFTDPPEEDTHTVDDVRLGRMAIRVVYSNLPVDMWGTDVAKRLIAQTAETYKPWIKMIPEEGNE